MTNKERVQKIVDWSWDSILYIDTIVGHSIGIQVRVKQTDNDKQTGQPVWRIMNYNSDNTMDTIALGVRVFISELINDKQTVKPGVHFPEQAIGTAAHRKKFLNNVANALNEYGQYTESILHYDPTVHGTWYDSIVGMTVSLLGVTPGVKHVIAHMKQNKDEQFKFLQRHL